MRRAPPNGSPMLRTLLRSRAKFRAFLIQHVGSVDAAEDILQQAYARVSARVGSLNKEESVVSWFFKILRRLSIDHYRSHSALKRRDDAFARESLTTQEHRSANERARERLCGCFEALLPALKKEYAVLLRRIDMDSERIEDVAQSLKLTPNNLSVRLHRARSALRRKLLQACGSCATHGCLDCHCTHPPEV